MIPYPGVYKILTSCGPLDPAETLLMELRSHSLVSPVEIHSMN